MPPDSQSTDTEVRRSWEQPDDAIVCYSEVAQIIGTGQEVVLQFYETIPGAPGPSGKIETARSRLRATVIVSKPHAVNIGRLLLKHAGSDGGAS